MSLQSAKSSHSFMSCLMKWWTMDIPNSWMQIFSKNTFALAHKKVKLSLTLRDWSRLLCKQLEPSHGELKESDTREMRSSSTLLNKWMFYCQIEAQFWRQMFKEELLWRLYCQVCLNVSSGSTTNYWWRIQTSRSLVARQLTRESRLMISSSISAWDLEDLIEIDP